MSGIQGNTNTAAGGQEDYVDKGMLTACLMLAACCV